MNYIPKVEESLASLDTTGFCVNCGDDRDGVEPDARGYRCDACGENTVYGIEELMVMGLMAVDH